MAHLAISRREIIRTSQIPGNSPASRRPVSAPITTSFKKVTPRTCSRLRGTAVSVRAGRVVRLPVRRLLVAIGGLLVGGRGRRRGRVDLDLGLPLIVARLAVALAVAA